MEQTSVTGDEEEEVEEEEPREEGNATASASDRRETSSFMLGCCNSEWTQNGSKLRDQIESRMD